IDPHLLVENTGPLPSAGKGTVKVVRTLPKPPPGVKADFPAAAAPARPVRGGMNKGRRRSGGCQKFRPGRRPRRPVRETLTLGQAASPLAAVGAVPAGGRANRATGVRAARPGR